MVMLAAAFGPAASHADKHAKSLGAAWQAFEAGNFDDARRIAGKIPAAALLNEDYRLYVLAESHALEDDCRKALPAFRKLAGIGGSRFARRARWRIADCQWQLGQHAAAQKSYRALYRKAKSERRPVGDLALAELRVGLAELYLGRKASAKNRLKRFLIDHPLHPEAERAARKLIELGGTTALTASQRIERARRLTRAKKWHQAIAELERIGDDVPAGTRRLRDYWMGMTFFKMRRQYERAGRILLGIYKQMGAEAARSLFHGARALSRADKDKEAIKWYERVVVEYPRSRWAPEALYLAGWLEFNMGNYRLGLPNLEATTVKYPRSRWARAARWFLGMSHFLLGEYDKALPYFERMAKGSGRLKGGKGQYWQARTLHLLGRKGEANKQYRALVTRYPFSWYALLAHSRLRELGIEISPFGDRKGPGKAAKINGPIDPKARADRALRAVDELTRAGLGSFAGEELRRSERGILKRYGRSKGMAVLLDRYRKAGNYNRPWMLAVVYGGARVLNSPPIGNSRLWWEHAYPRAYPKLVEEHYKIGNNPPLWLYAIMRKESGFDPNVHSYADARGLLQMIPATTKRVTKKLGLQYTADLLFDPENNIKTGAWYIGRLHHKFKGQIPMAAGSFNSGPRPIMRWLDKFKGQPTDVWVELASYTQTREYMKKVTENYARYLYLYEGKVYQQPLEVDSDYQRDEITY
ncbi:MAG: transglycosylase SLT domain-containing protein [Deltaproteobacteria bacterium]|nr:transglycosylase SLT domain-containing protein [Deltaproteobacteria bacterium]